MLRQALAVIRSGVSATFRRPLLILGLIVLAAVLIPIEGASAGEGRAGYRVGGHRTHSTAHRSYRHLVRMRTHRQGSAIQVPAGPSTGWPHPAASSGVMLGAARPGPGIYHVGPKHAQRRDMRHHHRRYGRHRSGTALVIVVGEGDAGAAPGLSGSEPFLEGPCKPNTYCTMRLGPYANSPKIITLNRSGKTIAE